VVFNLHTDTALGSVGNMRMFETTGLGACLLTDRGENLGELFEDGSEVVSYGSIEQCRERLRYLQENDSARQQIAAAGQARTLRDHTIANRCALVDHLLRERLG
jgi:spore maturation protein CgeB